MRGKYFLNLGVKQNRDLPLRVVLSMGEKGNWRSGVRMKATSEVYEPFMEEGATCGMGP